MSTLTDSKGRRVVDLDINYSQEVEDTYIESASYEDGAEVPEEELDWMQNAYADYLYESHAEHMQGAAEAYYDHLMDR